MKLDDVINQDVPEELIMDAMNILDQIGWSGNDIYCIMAQFAQAYHKSKTDKKWICSICNEPVNGEGRCLCTETLKLLRDK